MIVLLAAGLAALSAWLWWTPWDAAGRLACLEINRSVPDQSALLGSCPPGPPPAHGSGRSGDPATRGWRGRLGRSPREAVPMLSAALAGFLLIGGLPGLAVGAGAGAAVIVIGRRREPREARRTRARITADLPFAADLMVACLRAGQPVSGAVETTAEAVGGPLGERLAWVNGQLRLGAGPEAAWSQLGTDHSLAALARGMTRAAHSGSPVAEVLSRLADDARHEARSASSAAARRVAVQVVAPLGLCFLPAFVFLGIVPVVAGLAAQVFGG